MADGIAHAGRAGGFRDGGDELLECTVHYVDIFNYTCDGVTHDSTNCKGIILPEMQLNNSGELRMPACGDRILVRITKGGDCVYEKHLTGVEKRKDGRAQFDFLGKPRDHQHVRIPSLPGDYHKFTPGGGFFQMLRGGIMRYGVSPLCQFTMGKWENFWRMVSQNWELFSTGFNAYSTNHNGKVTSRFAWFRRDSWGLSYDKEWSKRSDYDLTVDINGMSFLAGKVEEGEWIRKNRLKIEILPDGTVKIDQGKISETNKYRQEIILGPEGKFFEHNQWNEKNEHMYHEHIETRDKGECTALIRMKGTYEVNVDGQIIMTAKTKASLSALMTIIGSTGNELQPAPSNVVIEGVKFTCNTPVYSFSGKMQ